MNTRIPVKRIKRAEVRYFESEHNGCEIPELKAYTYFLDIGGVYVNIFNPFEEYNVYKRVPYSNSTKDGENFGTMIKLISGKEEDGICYVLDKSDELFVNEDYISIEEFEEEIINKKEFIVDRLSLLESKRKTNGKIRKIIKRDMYQMKRLQDYIDSKEKAKTLKKVEN